MAKKKKKQQMPNLNEVAKQGLVRQPSLDMSYIKNPQQEQPQTDHEGLASLQKQTLNLQKTLEANQLDSQKPLDTRNPIEKALNLTPNQNVLFDVFEVINRPQQAIFNAFRDIDKDGKYELEDFFSGAWKGLTGQEKITGGGLLREWGMEDTGFGKNKAFGLDDFLGFGLDVLADPTNYITFGTHKLGKFGNMISKGTGKATINDAVFNTLGYGIKKTANLGDNIITAGLKKADKLRGVIPENATQHVDDLINSLNPSASNIVNKAQNGVDDIFQQLSEKKAIDYTKKASSWEEQYKQVKTIINDALSGAKNTVSNTLNKIHKRIRGENFYTDYLVKGNIEQFKQEYFDLMNTVYDDYKELLFDNMTRDEAIKFMDKGFNELIRKTSILKSKKDMITVIDLLELPHGVAKTGEVVIPYSKGVMQNLKKIFKDTEGFLDGSGKIIGLTEVSIKGKKAFHIDKENYHRIMSAIQDLEIKPSSLTKFKNPFMDFNDPKLEHIMNTISIDDKYADQLNNVLGIYDYLLETTQDYAKTKLSFSTPDGQYSPQHLSTEHLQILNEKNLSEIAETVGNITGTKYSARKFSGEVSKIATPEQLNNFYRDMFNENWVKESLAQADPKNYVKTLETLKNTGFYEASLSQNVLEFTDNFKKLLYEGKTVNELLVKQTLDTAMEINHHYHILSGVSSSHKQTLTQIVNSHIDNVVDDVSDAVSKTVNSAKNSAVKQQESFEALKKAINDSLIVPGRNGGIKVKGSLVGKIELNYDNFYYKMKNLSKFIGGRDLKKWIKTLGDKRVWGETIFLDARLANTLNIVSDIHKKRWELADMFIQGVDKFNNFWKRNKLLSPAYNVRNVVGNSFNLAMAGVPITEIPDLMFTSYRKIENAKKIINLLQQGDLPVGDFHELIVKYGKRSTLKQNSGMRNLIGYIADTVDNPAITRETISDFLQYNKLVRMGYGQDTAKKLFDMQFLDKSMKTTGNELLDKGLGAYNKVTLANAELNQIVDDVGRFSLMDYLERNPNTMTKLGFDNIGDTISYVLFDPENVSLFEKKYAKRIIPFYTFTKLNLGYQVTNLFKNNKRYYNAWKVMEGLWDMADPTGEAVSQYHKDSWNIPLGVDNDGNITTFKANMPVSDLGEWFSNPMSRLTASSTPLIKGMFEIPMNKQLFTGMPIESYRGQKSTKYPFLNKWGEYGAGLLGLDTPLNVPVGLGKALMGDMSGISQSINITTENNLNNVLLSNEYKKLELLQDHIADLKRKGVDVKSLTELKSGSKKLKDTQKKLKTFQIK